MGATYPRFGGALGILAGVAGFVYLVAFLVLKNPAASTVALALLVVGISASAALVALYERLRVVQEGFALWAVLLGVAGALGAATHAAFDLANNVNPPAAPFGYPSPVDPRGFLTFAVAGLATIVFGWLILRSGTLSRGLGYLGIVSGILLVALYVAYMLILSATNPLVLGLILLSGVIQPLWYLWLGYTLWQGEPASAPQAARQVRRG